MAISPNGMTTTRVATITRRTATRTTCWPRRKGDYSKHDGAWKEAKNDDGQPHTHHDPGEALAKFDFSHGAFASGPDHSGDIQAALASMSSDDALEYAISQMGPADHFDVGHFDVAAGTSNDTDG